MGGAGICAEMDSMPLTFRLGTPETVWGRLSSSLRWRRVLPPLPLKVRRFPLLAEDVNGRSVLLDDL